MVFITLGKWVNATDLACQAAGTIFYSWTQRGFLVVCLNEWCPSLNNPIDNDWAYRLTLEGQHILFDEEGGNYE